MLGKLLVALGPDNILWGTDSIWYGSPQGQIEAFRAFEITPEYQERFGYPALTADVKARILGLNAARRLRHRPGDDDVRALGRRPHRSARRGTRSRPDRPDHGRRRASHVRRRPPLVRIALDRQAFVCAVAGSATHSDHPTAEVARGVQCPPTPCWERRRWGWGSIVHAGERSGHRTTRCGAALFGHAPRWVCHPGGRLRADGDGEFTMIGHTSSTASIFDVPDGGDLVVALLFAGSTIVAIAMIVAVLGDSKCRARVSSAARLAAEDAARQVSPDRAMRAAQACRGRHADRSRSLRAAVDRRRRLALPDGRASSRSRSPARSRPGRSVRSIEIAAAPPGHRLGIDPARPLAH